ncbi:MAG: hypothetical protein ABSE89_07320 [Sedimentisphaerales bacterium]
MSNRIDFFQPQHNEFFVGSSAVSVYLDGQYCDFLVPEEITFAADPDFNQAVMSYYPKDGSLLPEETHSLVGCGQKIVLKSVYDAGVGLTQPEEMPIFAGFVDEIETIDASDKRKITIIAKDYSTRLRGKIVFGRNVCSNSGQTIFIAGADTVFNPDGKPNASKQNILQNGRSFRVFCADESQSDYFDCAEAIYYLLCEFIPAGQLIIPSLKQLKTLLQGRKIIDVDVTELNLIDALIRCCSQAGLRFKFVPSVSETAPSEAIVFFKPECCREVELNCQWPGQVVDISKTTVASVVGRKKFSPVTHRYIVQGDYRIYEATFELVKAWDPTLEENNYDRYSPLTNENFNEVRDVYRKWCLNEADDYSISPYNQGPAYDFSKVFEDGVYIRKRRRFMPTLSCGKDGSSIGYYLEVSYAGGSYWWPYMGSFKILLDQCGIWLSAEQLDTDVWFAIQKGLIKFRITASVMADERISFTIADGPVNSTIEVIDKIITLPRRFKYQKVSPDSIFVNGPANQADDTASLVEYARGLSDSGGIETERLQVKTMVLTPAFNCGDRVITSPDSRDILGVKYDNRSICWLEKIEMDFANQQTILTAVRKRK